jgi:hypothetical protein
MRRGGQDRVDEALRMHQGQVGDVDHRRFQRLQVEGGVVVQGVDHRLQPLGPLGVTVARPVVEHVGMGKQRDRHGVTVS